MALEPSIALGVRPLEVANPLTQYSQVAQLQAAQNQNQVSQMQLDQMRRDEETMRQIQAKSVEHGGPSDINAIADAYLKSGNPKFVEFGVGLRQKLDEKAQFAKIMSMGQPTAAPAPTNMPTAAPSGVLGSGTFGIMPTANNLAPAAAAPAPAPSVNALANPAVGPDVAMLRQKRDALLSMGTPQAIAAARALDSDINLASRESPSAIREFEYAKRNGYSGTFADFKTLHAPRTTVNVPVNVSTEKKYGEQFASKMADTDIAKMTTAEKAPQLAESANRIIDLVKQGNVFTGPVADVKLNIARALNVVGASNDEKIANTESLIAATGQSTLDAIKGAGLGTGQGFTDKDLKFLQGVAGGKIELTAQTLTELARLQHQTATRSAEAWNTRAKQLPKSSVEGTGLSIEPIKVPPLSPSAMFAVNPKTGERIQSLDGGNTWKPVGAK